MTNFTTSIGGGSDASSDVDSGSSVIDAISTINRKGKRKKIRKS